MLELHEDMQDEDQERKGVVVQGERARPLPQPRLPSRQEVQEHELTHIPYRSWCVHCVRGAGRSDAHRRRARQDEEEREQDMTTWSIDYAFMIDTLICAQERRWNELGGIRQRYSVGKRRSGHWRNPCTSCLGKRKRRSVDSRKDQGRHPRIWIRRCACSYQVGSRASDCRRPEGSDCQESMHLPYL